MVKIPKEDALDTIAEQLDMDREILDDLEDEEAINTLLKEVAEADDTAAGDDADTEGNNAPGVSEDAGREDAEATGSASGLLGEDATRAIVEGDVDAEGIPEDTLHASVDAVYGDHDPEDHTTGVAGGVGSGSMHPQQALMAAEKDDNSSDALDDYDVGMEGN